MNAGTAAGGAGGGGRGGCRDAIGMWDAKEHPNEGLSQALPKSQ